MLLLAHVFQTPASICNLIEVVVHQYISPVEPFFVPDGARLCMMKQKKNHTSLYQGTKANIEPHRHTFLKCGSTFVVIFLLIIILI